MMPNRVLAATTIGMRKTEIREYPMPEIPPGRRGYPWRNPCYCVAVAEIAANQPGANPGHIVTVTDFSPETLLNLVAHLEVSTSFEHLVYREAELDAIWSITGFFLASEDDPAKRDTLLRLHGVAHQAHDLVGQGRPRDAAGVLRALL